MPPALPLAAGWGGLGQACGAALVCATSHGPRGALPGLLRASGQPGAADRQS